MLYDDVLVNVWLILVSILCPRDVLHEVIEKLKAEKRSVK